MEGINVLDYESCLRDEGGGIGDTFEL